MGLSRSYGFELIKKYKTELEEMRQIRTEIMEKPSNLLEAKSILIENSPKFSQFIVDLVGDEDAPARERRQAAKDGLQLAGMQEATAPPPDYDRVMKNFILNVFYGKPFDEDLAKTLEMEPEGDDGKEKDSEA